MNASSAGEVVVSREVWQRLAGTGWGSGPVEETDGRSSPSGLRLLHWTPDAGGLPGLGCWDDAMNTSGHSLDISASPAIPVVKNATAAAGTHAAAPSYGAGAALKLPPGSSDLSPDGRGVSRRASHSGTGRVGPPAAAAAAAVAAAVAAAAANADLNHGRAASLDNVTGVATGTVRRGGR